MVPFLSGADGVVVMNVAKRPYRYSRSARIKRTASRKFIRTLRDILTNHPEAVKKLKMYVRGRNSPPFQGGVDANPKKNIAKPPFKGADGAIYLAAQPPLLGKGGEFRPLPCIFNLFTASPSAPF